MKIVGTSIEGLFVAEAEARGDNRGSFTRWFCEQELASVLGDRKIVQINHSMTQAIAAVRGMHFQYPPHVEMKMVRCIRGRVWDVAVDLRQGSSSFLHWHAEVLSAESRRMMVIPEGFAHGFQVLEADSELLYLHTSYYQPDAEGGLNPLDEALRIDWPLAVGEMSERDRGHSRIESDFTGVAP